MSLINVPFDCLLQVLASVSVKDCLALGCTCRGLRQTIKDDSVWKTLAERKWGHWVDKATVAEGQWQAYCRHRMNLESLPPSPLDLVQEQYPDPWQHLAACLMCSRTTGGPAVRGAIASLLAALPTPSALLDARKAEVLQLLRPVGLQDVRYNALVAMSSDFLLKGWEDPAEFKGCGKFVSDSWRIFCRGHRSVRDVDDATLQRYVRWLTNGLLEEKAKKKRQGQQQQQGARKGSAGNKRKGAAEAATDSGQGGGHWLRFGRNSPGEMPEHPDRRVTRSGAKKLCKAA